MTFWEGICSTQPFYIKPVNDYSGHWFNLFKHSFCHCETSSCGKTDNFENLSFFFFFFATCSQTLWSIISIKYPFISLLIHTSANFHLRSSFLQELLFSVSLLLLVFLSPPWKVEIKKQVFSRPENYIKNKYLGRFCSLFLYFLFFFFLLLLF